MIVWTLRQVSKFKSIFVKQSLTGLVGHPMWSVDTCRRTETIPPLLLFLKTFFLFSWPSEKWPYNNNMCFILALNMHCITCMILRRMLSFEKHLARLHIIFLFKILMSKFKTLTVSHELFTFIGGLHWLHFQH